MARRRFPDPFFEFAKLRASSAPKGADEGSCDFLRRLSTDDGQRIRDLLNDCLAFFDGRKKRELMGKLETDTDRQHQGAVAELLMFRILAGAFQDIETEPKIAGSLSRPDYLVHDRDGNGLIVEASNYYASSTKRYRESKEWDRMVEQIRSILRETIEVYPVFVHLRPVGVPQFWTLGDREQINLIEAITRHDNFLIYRSERFSIKVSVRSAPTRGTLTYSDYEYREGTHGTRAHIRAILRKIRNKSRKYSASNVPTLYCINATSAFLWLDDDVSEADFAPLFDCKWCDAVWVLDNLQVSNLGQITGHLYINPDSAELPILTDLKQHLNAPMYRLLGLGSDWNRVVVFDRNQDSRPKTVVVSHQEFFDNEITEEHAARLQDGAKSGARAAGGPGQTRQEAATGFGTGSERTSETSERIHSRGLNGGSCSSIARRFVWLRECSDVRPDPPGRWRALSLQEIGAAAARETLLIQTSHMAAIWTDLFQSLLASSLMLRWSGAGPGVGRDAKVAYSGLLGRYLTRAYMMTHEDVRVLLPLDLARKPLADHGYVIKKDPSGKVFDADWIGLDGTGLVIVEAKGSSDHTRTTWHHGRPSILRTAKQQVRTTAVFRKGSQRGLPARRWVVASRWANESDGLQPTLLVWDPEERNLEPDVRRTLLHVLFRAELQGFRKGFQLAGPLGVPKLQPVQVRVGDHVFPRGVVAVAGPFGIRPIRQSSDLSEWWSVARTQGNIAVMGLSVEYEEAVRRLPFDPERSLALLDRMRSDSLRNDQDHHGPEGAPIGVRGVSRSGLTVVWPRPDERIEFVDAEDSN